MVTIDEAQALLDEIAQELPEAFFRRLNGGICLLPDIKMNPIGQNNDLYIMGEYHASSSMGRFIEIYFGSMQRVFPFADLERMRHELREVLLHEFTHHLESMAGERGLEIKDAQQLHRYIYGE